MADLQNAIAIAVAAHAGQVDKGDRPYILHPLRVMMSLRTTEASCGAREHSARRV